MRAVYLTSVDQGSGKSVVALGLMEALSRSSSKIGYFRPVISADGDGDAQTELILGRYQLGQTFEQSYGVTADITRGEGANKASPEVVGRIIERFHGVADGLDIVLIEGTDYTGASKAFEFDLNAQIASHLGATALVVVSAAGLDVTALESAAKAARDGLAERAVPVIAMFVNRVSKDLQDETREVFADWDIPVYFLPEDSQLRRPTFRDVMKATSATIVSGADADITRTIGDVKVAAMTIPRLIDHLAADCLLVTPGDRSDVITMALGSRFTTGVPPVSGVLLTGGMSPDPAVVRFANGMSSSPMPLMVTPLDTYETAAAIAGMNNDITAADDKKIAAALKIFESNADVDAISEAMALTESNTLTPVMFEHRLVARARSDRRHIVLPEGEDDRILQAADLLLRRNVVDLTILGRPDDIGSRARQLGLDLSGAKIIDPENDPLREVLAQALYEARKDKGLAEDAAFDLVSDVSYFGTMMVKLGMVDGMVSGAAHTTAHTIRPALQVIKTLPSVSIVSSVFLMALEDRVLVYGDCAVNPNPNAAQLADIAISSADTAKAFGIEPRVAMLSYSTGASGTGADVDKVREATAIVKERAPELLVEGPIQYDAAVDESVAASKLPGSDVAGRATVFVFPDLNTGNNTYKAVQRSADAVAIGPILQGLRLPVNDLSRGALVEDIVNTVVITAIQAQQIEAP